MNTVRTDLAIEIHEMLMETSAMPEGVSVEKIQDNNIGISRVSIENLSAQMRMGKPVGTYTTIEFHGLNIAEGEEYESLCRVVAKELAKLLSLTKNSNVLVVGLGNQNITPDALGPRTLSSLMVTRHLLTYLPEEIEEGIRPVCAIAPGVLGTTGMETGEVIRGVVDKIKPAAVIVVDALAARSIDRIGTTIQLCDTGISPGAGVGNNRKELSRNTLGVPVIALGVPMVVDAATITADTLSLAAKGEGAQEKESVLEAVNTLAPEGESLPLRQLLPESLLGFMVTPKEVDLLVERVSKVVANGINFALHEGITFADIEAYTA